METNKERNKHIDAGVAIILVQRKYFIVADMIVSGEKNGSVAPSPKPLGIVAAGNNPFYFDRTIATMMGVDVGKIPTLRQIKNSKSKYKLYDGEMKEVILSNDQELNGKNFMNCL